MHIGAYNVVPVRKLFSQAYDPTNDTSHNAAKWCPVSVLRGEWHPCILEVDYIVEISIATYII